MRHLSLALPGLPVISVAIHRLSSVRGEAQAPQPLRSDIATPVYAQYGSNERGVCNRRLIEKERYAGSGGGLVNLDFVRFLEQGIGDDPREPDNPSSPRNVMNTTYFKPAFRLAREREEVLISEILRTKVGNYNYPGERVPSPNWPKVAPGRWGIVNAFSPKYCDLSAFAEIEPRPDVLWVRGADDRTVSDTSTADFGYLGKIGLVPQWPGEKGYPPQPMVSQIRAVLEEYAAVKATARRSSPTAGTPRT